MKNIKDFGALIVAILFALAVFSPFFFPAAFAETQSPIEVCEAKLGPAAVSNEDGDVEINGVAFAEVDGNDQWMLCVSYNGANYFWVDTGEAILAAGAEAVKLDCVEVSWVQDHDGKVCAAWMDESVEDGGGKFDESGYLTDKELYVLCLTAANT